MTSKTIDAHDGSSDDTIDVIRYVNVLIIHKWKFFILLSLVLLLILVYGFKQEAFYRSSFEIYYSEAAQQFVEASDVPVVRPSFDKHYWLSVMRSRELARQTLIKSGLSSFQEGSRVSISAEMVEDTEWWSSPRYIVTIAAKNNEDIPRIFRAYVQALNDMLVNHQIEFSANLIDYLSAQLSDNYKQLSRIDREILVEQASNPYQLRDLNKLASDLESFRNSLQHARIDLASVRASKKQAEEELVDLDPTVMDELAYSEPLKVQLMNLHTERARALTRQQEDHPRVRALTANIDRVSQLLAEDIEQTIEVQSLSRNPLHNQLLGQLLNFSLSEISLQTRVGSLQQVISEIENQMLPDTTDMDQQQLVRNRELIFMTINKLNNKLIDIQSATHGGLHRFLYVDEPYIPEIPANKGLQYFILLGLVLGAGIGIGGVFIYDYLDNRIMLLGDFESFYDLPVFGTLPHKKKAEKYFINMEYSQTSYHHRKEANEIIFFVNQHIKRSKKKLISVCSSVRSEGKSITSVQLAIGLAEKKMKVLLVDLDLFLPKLTEVLKSKGCVKQIGTQPAGATEGKGGAAGNLMENNTIKEKELISRVVGAAGKLMGNNALSDHKAGLKEYLDGEATLDEISLSTQLPTLTFIFLGKIEDTTDISFDTEKFTFFMNWARENYDVVIFDTPALMYLSNLVDFVEQTDMILPVLRLRYTTRSMFDQMLKMLKPYHEKIAGVVINDVKTNPSLGKYGDKYGYYTHYAKARESFAG